MHAIVYLNAFILAEDFIPYLHKSRLLLTCQESPLMKAPTAGCRDNMHKIVAWKSWKLSKLQ